MLSYFVRRLLVMIPTLLVISLVVFFIIQLPPGDFLETHIAELIAQGETVDSARIAFLREQYGLDKPMIEQYWVWLFGLLQGDLGYSFEFELPVGEVIGNRFWFTVLLAVATTIFTYIISFPIGIYSAVKQYSMSDYTVTLIGYFGLAMPNFLFALVLLHYANIWFGLSIGGLMDPRYIDAPWTLDKVISVINHLWIPMLVIGTSGTAAMIRRLRANMLDELQRQYVVTARAKGLSSTKIILKYPLRMALNPFIADIGMLLPQIVSGAALVSVVMDLPTNGPLLLRALQSQDMFLAGAFLMFEATLVVIGVFLSDVLLAMLDPRIRLGGASSK
ncbi:ABC transporter permease [Pelagibius litoralis]|uniref:ABC transporter permease n=1 Tax=Pelagibius litoralis TaxID=374515 RepID=A0A967KFY8_9PROT|nr:ABC transporter permease [Pelagibius litoralis]NIA71670.1 ABC transporter permease [Pelagibius litoralis]